MTTRPHLKLGRHLLPGLVAVALFVIMAFTFLTASFGVPEGFPGQGSITASIGYAMFNLDGGAYPSEGFLVAFEIIDLVLVAALAASIMLAKTEEGGRISGALRFKTDSEESAARTDGGREASATENGEDR